MCSLLFAGLQNDRNETPFSMSTCPTWMRVLNTKKSYLGAQDPIKHKSSIELAPEVVSTNSINYLAKVDTALMKPRPCYKPRSQCERGFD